VDELRLRMGKVHTFIIDQELLNNSKLEDLFKISRVLQWNFQSATDLEIFPLAATSKDYNQSVHRTVNPINLKYFWSCAGSPTPEAEECLDYKFPVKTEK
jgi:hypothetical protein